MQMLSANKAVRRRKLLRLNILIASIVFLVSFVLMVSGDYSSLQERKASETIYNMIIVGSLLYMAGVWLFCTFSKPFWFPEKANREK